MCSLCVHLPQVGQLNEDVMALRTNKQTILLRQSQLHAFVGRLRDHKGAAGGKYLIPAPVPGQWSTIVSSESTPPYIAVHQAAWKGSGTSALMLSGRAAGRGVVHAGGELAPESGWLASSLSTKGAPPAAAFHLVLAAIQDALAQYPRSMASTFLQPTPGTGSSAAAIRQPSSEAGTPHGLGKAAGRTPPWSSTPTKLSGKKRKTPKSKQRGV